MYTLQPNTEPLKSWSDTRANTEFEVPSPSQLTPTTVLRKCSKVVLSGGDVGHLGGFVLFRRPEDGAARRPRIGRVLEIIADNFAGILLGVLVHEYQ